MPSLVLRFGTRDDLGLQSQRPFRTRKVKMGNGVGFFLDSVSPDPYDPRVTFQFRYSPGQSFWFSKGSY
jgi:hypothetical protein